MAADNGTYTPLRSSLSARLLVLTVGFVMLSEVLIYAPSVARFRHAYLEDRLAAGHLATLALEATPDNMVSPELEAELLRHSMAHLVRLRKPGRSALMLKGAMPPGVDATVDLREQGFFRLIMDAFTAMLRADNRVLRVIGSSPRYPDVGVEVIIDEAPMRASMRDFSERILLLSLFISLITASLVYLSLQWLMVRPMRRITESMITFRRAPEDAANVVRTSDRRDEIGVAFRELAMMQADLRAALWQKTRLAALGQAVTKINHDLRGILSTALLVSDRLEASADPEVRRVTPSLVSAIDRAVDLCRQTLGYAREGPPALALGPVALAALIDEAAAAVRAPDTRIDIAAPPGLTVVADRDQLFRVLFNLLRNAVQAGARTVRVTAEATGEGVTLRLRDDGPGIPDVLRQTLFQPFAGSGKPDGSGLGLVIARDLMRAHGGDIELVQTGPDGTEFALHLPPERD